jgi:hypothetical protein
METYRQRKDAARDAAIELQNQTNERAVSWKEITEICAYFEKQGKRYGLLTEFRENGLI